MNWLPPRSLAERSKWAADHPWIAGCYAGLMFSAILAVVMIRTGVGPAVVFGLLTWFAFGALFALLVRRRWGKRPDAENYPAPTLRRMWSRTSDRMLSRLMWVSAAAALFLVIELITESDSTLRTVFPLAVYVLLAGTVWAERKRRRMSA